MKQKVLAFLDGNAQSLMKIYQINKNSSSSPVKSVYNCSQIFLERTLSHFLVLSASARELNLC